MVSYEALSLNTYTGGTSSDGMSCEELEEKVEESDRKTEIIYPPPVVGKWVSQKCEVRTGPEYVLRSHWFRPNGTFESVMWYYDDEWCGRPLYSVHVRGRYSMRGRSWLTPGATRADYTPHTLVMIPFTQQVADELSVKVNSSCPNRIKKRWKPHQEHLIISYAKDEPVEEGIAGDSVSTDESRSECGRSLYKEGALVRVERRPGGLVPNAPRATLHLLLGELRSHATRNSQTTFRPPLLRAEQWDSCEVCRWVGRGKAGAPPQLAPQPRVPLQMAGEWISVSCEARPLGLFLRRKLRIQGSSWRAEYKFYTDPLCSTPSLTAAAEGYYKKAASLPPQTPRVQGATDFDFVVQRAFLTLHDVGLVHSLQGDKSCGTTGKWQIGRVQDLTLSKGCAPLGIAVPSTEYELARLEVDTYGNTMLLLGQSESGKSKSGSRPVKYRPTAFQPPLLQCNAPELPPLTHFLNGYNSALTRTPIRIVTFSLATSLIISVSYS